MNKLLREKDQVTISENLYEMIFKYINEKQISFETFCKEINMPVYMMGKIVDPKIRMSASPVLFDRIYRHIVDNTPQVKHKIHF